MNVNPAVIDQFRLPLTSAGILVSEVGGRGRRSGLKPGDLILAVNGRVVSDVDTLEAAVRRNGELILRVDRKGRRGNVKIGG
jgi:S1-C subfamily serine protease